MVDCSIVMLAHNGAEFTQKSLASILAARSRPRQMLFADNGSTDGTPALAEHFAPRFREAGIDFVTWRNAENLGCSEGRNLAWERATSRYVMFLDNDCCVCTSDWLDRLAARLDADPRLGILGPKLIYPLLPHPIQCAGVAVNPKGRIRFRGRGARRDDPAYAQYTPVPLLISACWLMRREFYHEIGGLDPLFHPVQFEDLDYCMRVTRAGYTCAYTPDVEMYHFEGITTASFGQETYQRNIVAQSAKFRERWREVLRTFPEDPADYRWLSHDELGLTGPEDLSLVE